MSDFVPIPSKPGYLIDTRGRVEFERSGMLLAVDKWGRVQLRQGGRTEYAYIGHLLAEAGFFSCPADKEALARAEEQAADLACRLKMAEDAAGSLRRNLEKANAELSVTREALDKARKANALLMGMRRAQAAELAGLKAAAVPAEGSPPRRGRPPKRTDYVPRVDAAGLCPAQTQGAPGGAAPHPGMSAEDLEVDL